jgi:hypothetical protein
VSEPTESRGDGNDPPALAAGDARGLLLAAAVLGLLTVLVMASWIALFGRSPTAPSPSRGEAGEVVTTSRNDAASPPASSGPGATSGSTPTAATSTAAPPQLEPSVELDLPAYTAQPYETVPLTGVVEGLPSGTLLRVQHWQAGRWLSFPLPTATDDAGRFTAYVEMGAPGVYQVRVTDPRSGATSRVVTLEID